MRGWKKVGDTCLPWCLDARSLCCEVEDLGASESFFIENYLGKGVGLERGDLTSRIRKSSASVILEKGGQERYKGYDRLAHRTASYAYGRLLLTFLDEPLRGSKTRPEFGGR